MPLYLASARQGFGIPEGLTAGHAPARRRPGLCRWLACRSRTRTCLCSGRASRRRRPRSYPSGGAFGAKRLQKVMLCKTGERSSKHTVISPPLSSFRTHPALQRWQWSETKLGFGKLVGLVVKLFPRQSHAGVDDAASPLLRPYPSNQVLAGIVAQPEVAVGNGGSGDAEPVWLFCRWLLCRWDVRLKSRRSRVFYRPRPPSLPRPPSCMAAIMKELVCRRLRCLVLDSSESS